MTDQDWFRQTWLIQMKSSDDRKDIVAQAVGRMIVIVGRGIAGLAKAAAGDPVRMIFASKFRRELVELVRGVAQSAEEDERPTSSTPIEHFELDARLDGDKLHSVR